MKLQKISKYFKILIAVNIFIVTFLYADFLLPSSNMNFEKFSKLESYVKRVVSGRHGNGSSLESINFIYCKSQNIYEIFAINDCATKIAENQEIVVKKTIFLSKIKNVEIQDGNDCKTMDTTFLENDYVLFSFCLTILISVLFLFFSNMVLDILLAFATVYIYFSTIVYLFYIE